MISAGGALGIGHSFALDGGGCLQSVPPVSRAGHDGAEIIQVIRLVARGSYDGVVRTESPRLR